MRKKHGSSRFRRPSNQAVFTDIPMNLDEQKIKMIVTLLKSESNNWKNKPQVRLCMWDRAYFNCYILVIFLLSDSKCIIVKKYSKLYLSINCKHPTCRPSVYSFTFLWL